MTARTNGAAFDPFTFADVFGVTLDGEPAKIDAIKGGRMCVRSASNRVVFNPSVAVIVCKEKGGRFISRTLPRRLCV